MPINIFAGRKNVVFAKTNKALSSLFNSSNVTNVFDMSGTPISWRPDRQINGFSSTVVPHGYIVQAIADMDRTADFEPPFTGTSGVTEWSAQEW